MAVRRRRRLLNLVTAISLLLAITFAGLCARGRLTWRYDAVIACRRPWGLAAKSGPFGITFGLTHDLQAPGSPYLERHSFPCNEADADTMREHFADAGGGSLLGIYWTRPGMSDAGWWRRELHLPHWLTTGLVAPLPVVRGIAWWRRRRRVLSGCCVACGYDLRASSKRCPECGEEAATDDGQHGPYS